MLIFTLCIDDCGLDDDGGDEAGDKREEFTWLGVDGVNLLGCVSEPVELLSCDNECITWPLSGPRGPDKSYGRKRFFAASSGGAKWNGGK